MSDSHSTKSAFRRVAAAPFHFLAIIFLVPVALCGAIGMLISGEQL